MARVVVVSFRLGGTDGVSIEAAKWIAALRSLGHAVTTVAGSGDADELMPSLAIRAGVSPSVTDLSRALRRADVIIVENLVSLPLNVAARDTLYDVLQDRRVIFRHHDLAWQRASWSESDAPRSAPTWSHVVINRRSQEELRARGIEATLLYNRFDCDPPLGRRSLTRDALGLADERLVLMPSRALERKNVPGAVQLASALSATLWILGAAEDGYEATLAQLERASHVPLVLGVPPEVSVHDAYAACDVVVVPSTWEGFGNPVLESVTHRRPLAVFPYPVLEELREFGFRFFDLGEHPALIDVIEHPDDALLEANSVIARQHFDLADLASELAAVLASSDAQVGN